MIARLTRFLLCLLLVLLMAPRLALAWNVDPAPAASASLHLDGTPCHDGTDAGAPCDGGCSCVCCATVRVAAPPVAFACAAVRGSASLLAVPEPPALHPFQPILRLYRPPRV